jgi:hypothetical protein
MATKLEQSERAEAIERLRELVEPGDHVSTILRHVSKSGMTRAISLVICKDDGWPNDISWLAARAMGEKIDQRHDGIKVSGCGMDMGFHLVYNLGRTLWPDGFLCTGEGTGWYDRCPANDHANDRERDYRPGVRLHPDGGYALNHRWL